MFKTVPRLSCRASLYACRLHHSASAISPEVLLALWALTLPPVLGVSCCWCVQVSELIDFLSDAAGAEVALLADGQYVTFELRISLSSVKRLVPAFRRTASPQAICVA
eukprot:COSAG02_NODE_7513_length_2977_cov_8.453092_1_plen_107_part_10